MEALAVGMQMVKLEIVTEATVTAITCIGRAGIKLPALPVYDGSMTQVLSRDGWGNCVST